MCLCVNGAKRILIITLHYAPSAQVGGKRFTFLSDILQKRYPDLHILTSKQNYFSPQDYSLKSSGIIHRAGIYPLYFIDNGNVIKKILNRLWADYLCLVDPFSGWILPALIKGFRVIKHNTINLIIATGPPFSAFVVAYLLSRITSVDLILDYRDPWTNHKRTYTKLFGKKLNQILEKLSVKQSSTLVFCTRMMKDNFEKSLGRYTKAAFHVVHNGFNNKDTIQPLFLGQARKNMVYAGNFYGQRSIKLLAKSLFNLLNQGSITKDTFCLHVFGNIKNEDTELINKYGLHDVIREQPFAPYEQLVRYLKGADILLLLSGSDVEHATTYKFYDYLSVRKPILAIAPENSAVAELMNKIDCGQLAIINNEKSIFENFHKILCDEKTYSFSGADRFTWDKIGRRYSSIIDSSQKPKN